MICNIGSLEIHASTYISAKLKKRSYTHESLWFPVEMNTIEAVKLQQLLFLFTQVHRLWDMGYEYANFIFLFALFFFMS